MRKMIIVFILVMTVLVFTAQALAEAGSTEIPSNNKSPYPPPEMTSTTIGNTSSNLSTPYPGPVDTPEIITDQQTSSNDILEYGYSIFLPIIMKSYDRIGAVNYADMWAHDRNSNYPNFGTGCGCNDCTNYVSQSLHNGGIPLRTGNWDENSVFEWWYKKTLWWYDNSKTWSATDWFNTYLFQYPDEFEFRSWPTELEAGDFFLMDLRGAEPEDPPDGIPDHARFVVGYGWSSVNQQDYTDGCGANLIIPPTTYGLLVNQHCVDRKHVAWDYMIEGIGLWPFHVK